LTTERILTEATDVVRTEADDNLTTEASSLEIIPPRRVRRVRAEAQRSAPDARVYLYEVDTAPVGGPVYTWTPGPFGSRNAIPSAWVGWIASGPMMGGLSEALSYPLFLLEPDSSAAVAFTAIPDGQTETQTGPACPATPGLAYAFTTLALPYRVTAVPRIEFLDSAGAVISQADGAPLGLTSLPSSAQSEDRWSRLYVDAVAPTSGLSDGLVRARAKLIFSPLAGGWASSLYLQSRPYLGIRGAPGSQLWTPGDASGQAYGEVRYLGVTYKAVPIQIEGIQRSPRGTQPRVTVSIPNIGGFASQLLAAHKNLLNCKVTRRTTFKRFLDGMPGAGDASATFDTQVWYIDRVALISPEVVQLEGVAATDIQGVMLPRRTILRDACTHTYRRWNATTASFIQGTCPYAGTSYFKADGMAATPSEDDCGRRLKDCIARFPTGVLPTRAFPGVGRLRS